MAEALWLAGMLVGNLWSAGAGIAVLDVPEGGLPPFPVAAHAEALPPAPPSIPAAQRRGADAPRTPMSLPQVQFDVTIAEIDRAAIPGATYRWMRQHLGFTSENARFSVLKGPNECGELLRALCTDKLAKILAEPRIQTLSGRPAYFASGGVTTTEGHATITYFDTSINLLPIIKDNGKIMLEVHVDLRRHNAPNHEVRSARASAVMEAGRTLALVGLVAQNADGKEREFVVLVTPTLPAACASAKPQRRAAPADIVNLDCPKFMPRKPGAPDGSHNVRGEHLVRPDGTISLGMFGSVHIERMTAAEIKAAVEKSLSPYVDDPRISVQVSAYVSRKIYIIVDNGNGQKVHVIPAQDAQTVLDVLAGAPESVPIAAAKKIWVARPMPHGTEGVLILPVEWHRIIQAGETKTNYLLQAGDRIYVETRVLRAAGPDTVQAGNAALPGTVAQTQAESAKGPSLPATAADVVALSVADVVALSKAGVSNAIILRQMDSVKALADVPLPAHQLLSFKQAAKHQGVLFLTVDDLMHLKQQGVSDELVLSLQERFLEAMRPGYAPSPTGIIDNKAK